jgi:prefoldin subunit 1
MTNNSQIFQEISQKKAFSEQQLLIVRQQKTARTREARLLELTSSEVSSLPKDTKVYEGVGKMYVHNYIRASYFKPIRYC